MHASGAIVLRRLVGLLRRRHIRHAPIQEIVHVRPTPKFTYSLGDAE